MDQMYLKVGKERLESSVFYFKITANLIHPNMWSLQRKELNKSEKEEGEATAISNNSNALIGRKKGRRKL